MKIDGYDLQIFICSKCKHEYTTALEAGYCWISHSPVRPDATAVKTTGAAP